MRLSIIVPAYKVADFIEKCIRSLEDQDISQSEYEIIVTNDGSPDQCKEIIENLQHEFSNLVLINQENQGVSMARNNAIAIAKGAYILPIDPDDYVVPNTFKHFLAKAETNELDILYLGFEIFDADEKSIWKTDYSSQEKSFYNGIDGYFVSRGYDVKDPDRSWAILFKKQLLDKFEITYPKDVPYLEDGLFLAKVFVVAQSVAFDQEIFYQRTTRKGSATNSTLFYSEKAIQGFIHAIEDIKLFGECFEFQRNQKLLINHVVAKFTILPLTSIIGQKNIGNYYKFITRLKENNLNKINVEGLRLDYLKIAKIYNRSPLLFFFYYPIITKLRSWTK
jgi:glycosyltransferase involved in cell wall biosynthesis